MVKIKPFMSEPACQKAIIFYVSPLSPLPPLFLKTLQCPHCKTLNTIGARICINCRKPLAVEEVMDREEKAMKIFGDFVDLAAENPKFMERFNKHFGENKINKD